MRSFQGIYKFRPSVDGDKNPRLIFNLEQEYDLEEEKEQIYFRKKPVKVSIVLESNPDVPIIEDNFNVKDVKYKYFSGDRSKLNLIIDQDYDKDKEIVAVGLRREQIILTMEEIKKDIVPANTKSIEETQEGDDLFTEDSDIKDAGKAIQDAAKNAGGSIEDDQGE